MKVLYIDSQNMYLGLKELGIVLDFKKFYEYCKNKGFDEIIMFFGYSCENKNLYKFLGDVGFKLFFKKTYSEKGSQKANVDIDIAIKSVNDYRDGKLTNFCLLSGDCDFVSLIDFFQEKGAFSLLFVPNLKKTNISLRKSCDVSIVDLSDIRKYGFLHKKMPSRND